MPSIDVTHARSLCSLEPSELARRKFGGATEENHSFCALVEDEQAGGWDLTHQRVVVELATYGKFIG
jgi:hypothetical protein